MRFGAFIRNAFGSPAQDPDAVLRVKEWALQALQGPSDTVLVVNEIACNDPSCPGVETIILVMEPGRKTRACKVQKPLDEVTEPDVRRALES